MEPIDPGAVCLTVLALAMVGGVASYYEEKKAVLICFILISLIGAGSLLAGYHTHQLHRDGTYIQK